MPQSRHYGSMYNVISLRFTDACPISVNYSVDKKMVSLCSGCLVRPTHSVVLFTAYFFGGRTMLIAFTGRKRNGKTYTCNLLQARHPEYEIISFATPIKDCAKWLLGDLPMDKDNGVIQGLSHKISPRDLYRAIGELRTTLYPTFWIDLHYKRIQDKTNVLIDDLRYPNEADYVRSLGGKIYRVVSTVDTNDDTHPSEVAQDEILVDDILYNDKSSAYDLAVLMYFRR